MASLPKTQMPEELPQRRWLRHQVPDEVNDPDPVFFLTICCRERGGNQLATGKVWTSLEETILHRNDAGVWRCTLFLAMPDHIHGIFRFSGDPPMKSAIAHWKRWTSTKLNLRWQKGFFDHRLRDEANAIAKRGYILHNPVRAGLVATPEDWPYVHDTFR